MNSSLNVTHNFSRSSNVTETPTRYFQEPNGVRIFRLFLSAAIAAGGVIGNILVCLVISRCFRVKTPIHFYIFNLAIADLGVLLVNFPFAVLREQSPNYWPLGEVVCVYVYPFSDVFYGVSIWSIACIAIERYQTIASVARISLRQSSLFRNTTRNSVYRALAVIWIVSFIVVALPAFFVIKYNETHRCYVTFESYAFEQAYNLTLVIFWYLLPLAIVAWTYVYVERCIRQSTKFHKEMNKNKNMELSSGGSNDESAGLCNTPRIKQNSKVRRILTPVLVVFAITMLPTNVFRLALTYREGILSFKYFFVLYNVCVFLIVLNSACNAFIYSLVSKEFRQGFLVLVSKK